MADFSTFAACVDAIRQGADQAKIDEAGGYITNQLLPAPGFCDFLVEFVQNAISRNDLYAILFTLTQMKNLIKAKWEPCGELFLNREGIRAATLELLANPICGDERVLNLVVAVISSIADTDYPSAWRQLMPTLTEALDKAESEGNGQIIMVILYAVSEIFKRYERGSDDSMAKELKITYDFWDKRIVDLISDVIPAMLGMDAIPPVIKEKCLEYTLLIFRAMSQQDLPDRFLVAMPVLFTRFQQFFDMDSGDKVKTALCLIMKQYIVRYITEIGNWGTTEMNPQEEEAIMAMKQIWASVLASLMNVLARPNNSGVLMGAAFDALSVLARSRDKAFFLQGDNLLQLCSSVLIPAIQLTEQDEEDFKEVPLDYFTRDIEGVENEGRNRQVAYLFLRTLSRSFREQLTSVFGKWCEELIGQYQANPSSNWRQMDTAIFIMGTLVTQYQLPGQAVREVHHDINLEQFLVTFILPQLQVASDFPVLQADALKFIVDFRNVIPRPVLAQIWPAVIQLFNSPHTAIVLYAYYCIDQLCSLPEFAELPVLLSQSNPPALVERLFTTFTIGDQYNIPAAKCLLRLVVTGGSVIFPAVKMIVHACADYIRKLANRPNQNADFCHALFEILAAAVSRAKFPVNELEEDSISLMVAILQNEVTEYMSYTFQIIACYLAAYPEGVRPSNFYYERFSDFLAPHLWLSLGNIPGLAVLLRSYCIKCPELVMGAFDAVGSTCQKLLTGARTHLHALSILMSVLRFIPPEMSAPALPAIMQLVTAPTTAEEQILKYQTNFALFMSDACWFIGPDAVVSHLPNPDHCINYWSEGLKYVRTRANLECACEGSMKALCTCTVLTPQQWAMLFKGIVMMLEAPSRDVLAQDIGVMRMEERDAMQFDIPFSKLVYSELEGLNPHPELREVDLVKRMAIGLAEYSQAHPGVIGPVAAEVLPPAIQKSLERYPAIYGVAFA